MDADRFDRVTKLLSSGASRRRVLGGLIGGVLGTFLGHDRAAAQLTNCPTPATSENCPQCYTCFTGICPFLDGHQCGPCHVCRFVGPQGPSCSVPPDRCFINGQCLGRGAASPGNPCQACNPAASQTAYTDAPNGTFCSPGNVCNPPRVCQNGTCQPATPLICEERPCFTLTGCDPQAGCQYSEIACTSTNPCLTGGFCNTTTSQCEFTKVVCADPDACNIGSCDPNGGCISTPRDCSHLTDACHDGVCDVAQGGCVAQPKVACPGATVCCPSGKFAGQCRDQSACENARDNDNDNDKGKVKNEAKQRDRRARADGRRDKRRRR